MPAIVIPKNRSKEENLPSGRLLRAEMNALVGIFHEYCGSVVISDDDYVYQDLQEMRERVGPRLRKFRIEARCAEAAEPWRLMGINPTVTLTLEPYVLKLSVLYKG